MKIYALKGRGESGKTTTLKYLILNILTSPSLVKIIYSNGKVSKEVILQELYDERTDRINGVQHLVENYQVVFSFENKIIGINTSGDNKDEVNKSIEILKKYNCDVGFCACRSKGETVKLLCDNFGACIEFIPKAEIKNANKYKNYNEWINLLNEWQSKQLFKNI